MNNVKISGVNVKINSNGYVSLRNLHEASGRGGKSLPRYWVKRKSAESIKGALLKSGIDAFAVTYSGGYDIYAHKQAALVYTASLGADFHLEAQKALSVAFNPSYDPTEVGDKSTTSTLEKEIRAFGAALDVVGISGNDRIICVNAMLKNNIPHMAVVDPKTGEVPCVGKVNKATAEVQADYIDKTEAVGECKSLGSLLRMFGREEASVHFNIKLESLGFIEKKNSSSVKNYCWIATNKAAPYACSSVYSTGSNKLFTHWYVHSFEALLKYVDENYTG